MKAAGEEVTMKAEKVDDVLKAMAKMAMMKYRALKAFGDDCFSLLWKRYTMKDLPFSFLQFSSNIL